MEEMGNEFNTYILKIKSKEQRILDINELLELWVYKIRIELG